MKETKPLSLTCRVGLPLVLPGRVLASRLGGASLILLSGVSFPVWMNFSSASSHVVGACVTVMESGEKFCDHCIVFIRFVQDTGKSRYNFSFFLSFFPTMYEVSQLTEHRSKIHGLCQQKNVLVTFNELARSLVSVVSSVFNIFFPCIPRLLIFQLNLTLSLASFLCFRWSV